MAKNCNFDVLNPFNVFLVLIWYPIPKGPFLRTF